MAAETKTTIRIKSDSKDEADVLKSKLEKVLGGVSIQKGDFYDKIFQAGLEAKRNEIEQMIA